MFYLNNLLLAYTSAIVLFYKPPVSKSQINNLNKINKLTSVSIGLKYWLAYIIYYT